MAAAPAEPPSEASVLSGERRQPRAVEGRAVEERAEKQRAGGRRTLIQFDDDGWVPGLIVLITDRGVDEPATAHGQLPVRFVNVPEYMQTERG